MFDLILQGGEVYDGSGAAPLRADVGIRGERIAAVGDLSNAESRRKLDVRGQVVCPGFIDVHTHSDAYLLIEPTAPSKIFQGVTTEIAGNCGASAAPLMGAYQMPSDWRSKQYPGTWQTVAEYRSLLAQARPAVNVSLLIGHNTLRAGVVGYDARPAASSEVRAMERALEQALDEGARGLSTGLIYPPGMYAPADEVQSLARVAGRHGGVYTSHMRSEGAGLLAAIRETLEVGRRSGCRVEISHLKTSGRENWPLVDQALGLIAAAREAGEPVAADRYPYTASCTDLDVILPDWVQDGGRDAVLARLRNAAVCEKIRAEILARRDEDYWEIVHVGSTTHPDNTRFRGWSLRAVGAELGMDPVDAAFRLMLMDELQTGGIFFGMSEDNMWKILAAPFVMLGSDASIRAPQGQLSADFPHPRAYGSFPRFIRASLEGRTAPLAEAIRKCTSLPAEQFGFAQRGRLQTQYYADVLVFDPQTLCDNATYAAPHQFSSGVTHLIINGCLTICGGVVTEGRNGQWV